MLLPRARWAAALEDVACECVSRADEGFETNVEIWKTSDGRLFLVPFDEDEEGERWIASFRLDRIIGSLGIPKNGRD